MTSTVEEDERRSYHSPLREARAEQTREQIVAAAYQKLQVVPPHELSYADIAEELEISPRTVYRHFPEREELVAEVSQRHIRRILGPIGGPPTSLPAVAHLLRHMFALLEREPGTYRLFFHLPVRSEGGVRSIVEQVFGDAIGLLPEADRPAATGLFELLISPYAYDVLHENIGLSADDAVRTCLVALDLLAKGLERDPDALSASRSLPPRFADPTE